MEKIKIYTLLESSVAINEEKGAKIGNTILGHYKESHSHLLIDFSDMRVVISPFVRELLKPLHDNGVDYEGIGFTDETTKNIYDRVVEEFQRIGTESIREITV